MFKQTPISDPSHKPKVDLDDDSLNSVSNSRPAAKEASRKTGLEDQAAGTVGTQLAQDNESSDNTTALLISPSCAPSDALPLIQQPQEIIGMLLFFEGNIWLYV